MLEAQGWHLVDAELVTSEQPAMSGDHLALAINQDRDIEVKGLDAFSNLLDLFFAVLARVREVRFKLGSRGRKMISISRWLAAIPAGFIRLSTFITNMPTIGRRVGTTRRLAPYNEIPIIKF
jgi:hypothetical protein